MGTTAGVPYRVSRGGRRRRPPAWMGPAGSPTPRLVASPHVSTRPVPGVVPGNAWVDYRRTMALFPLLGSTPLRRHCHLTATCRDGSLHPYPLAVLTRYRPSGRSRVTRFWSRPCANDRRTGSPRRDDGGEWGVYVVGDLPPAWRRRRRRR